MLGANDELRKTTIRGLLSSIHNAEIQAGKPLDDSGVISVLSREMRQRRESIEEYGKGGRQDLVDREQAELDILSRYMPAQLSREEVVETAKRVIESVGAHGPADKGKVMPVIMGELRGKAEGAQINAVVTELLSQG